MGEATGSPQLFYSQGIDASTFLSVFSLLMVAFHHKGFLEAPQNLTAPPNVAHNSAGRLTDETETTSLAANAGS